MSKLVWKIRRKPAFVVVGALLTAGGFVLSRLDEIENFLERRTPRHVTEADKPPLEKALRLATSALPARARAEVRTEVVTRVAANYNLRLDEVGQAADEFFRRFDHGHESLMRGGELFGQRRFQEAKIEYESAVQFDPENTSALSSLGAVNMMLGDREAARVAYDRAFQLAPGDWQLQYNYGLFFARTGRPRDSLKYLKPALHYLREHAELRGDLDAVLLELKNDAGLAELQREPGFSELVGSS